MKTWMIAALLLLIWGCDDQGLPPDDTLKPAVTVEFLEASCTEAWLRLVTRNVSPPYTMTLLRNDSAIATFSSPPADTTVIDEGLAPSRTYTYRARVSSPSRLNLTGNPAQARTLDTTSHQFTWETMVLGDGGSSTFYDVAIVNDTLAYAVGEVYLRDSSGVLDHRPYNLAKWDGRRWQLLRIQFYTFCGQPDTGPYPARSIFAFAASDIWIGMDGSQVVRWNGQSQTSPVCIPVSAQKLWGQASNSVYAVGRGGGIAHFDGTTWRRVESGTSVALSDVWGSPDGSVAWACGWEDFMPTVLLRLRNGTAELAYQDPYPFILRSDSLSGILTSVYTNTGSRLYVASMYGLYRTSAASPLGGKRYSFTETYLPGFPYRLRGSGANDLTLVGEYAMVAHFNGVSWRHFEGLMNQNRRLRSVAQRGNLVIAVGAHYDQPSRSGLVLVGRR
jgi:hypothetical protein